MSLPTRTLPGIAVSMCLLVLVTGCYDAGDDAAASQSYACANVRTASTASTAASQS